MADENLKNDLKSTIKSYPDFPKEGIIFRDFFPVFQNATLFDGMITLFAKHLKENSVAADGIVGLESRGFLIGPPLALKLGVPFIPIRKAGKLPGSTVKEVYELEYGTDAFELQSDSIKNGQNVVIIDDLLATGGSMAAAVKLVRKAGGVVELCLVVIELEELKGKLKVPAPTFSLFHF